MMVTKMSVMTVKIAMIIMTIKVIVMAMTMIMMVMLFVMVVEMTAVMTMATVVTMIMATRTMTIMRRRIHSSFHAERGSQATSPVWKLLFNGILLKRNSLERGVLPPGMAETQLPLNNPKVAACQAMGTCDTGPSSSGSGGHSCGGHPKGS